jgi:signal transduction histidine kinase
MEAKRKCVDVLTQNLPEILNHWEARTLKEVSAAYGQPSLILRNSLSDFLKFLATLLSTQQRSSLQIGLDAANLLKSSKEHGKGRAEIPAYVLSQVILEYQILRQVLFQVLEQNCDFTLADREALTTAIEDAVNVATQEFTSVLREIQDQFMLSIAHDLKNPITAAQTGAELIRLAPKSELTIPLAENMIKSMKKMNEMVEEFHDTSRLRAGRELVLPLSDCDINEILREVIAEMQVVYGNCFLIQAEGPLHGQWNANYLRRLIENIVNNAAKYRSPGTQVALQLRGESMNALLIVHNQGEPIPPSQQAQLFSAERWKKSGRTLKGWGLGMSIAKGIVDALGGTIQVESKATTGTTFTLSLPRTPKVTQAETKAG